MPGLGEPYATGDVHGSTPYALGFPAAAFRFSQYAFIRWLTARQ